MTNYREEASSAGDGKEGLVCTLFEGHYHFGLGALLNSLVQAGFQGCVTAGYRGALPPWIDQLKAGGNGRYEITDGAFVEFVPIDTRIHFGNFKPQFMKQLLGRHPGCKYIFYFDPDIVIRVSWPFFIDWVSRGIALCEDINGEMPENHPMRHQWMDLASATGMSNPRPLNRYYNSGFAGLPARFAGFLDLWEQTMLMAENCGLDIGVFGGAGVRDRTYPFHMPDQDALNIALMFSNYPLTTLGPSGMGFAPGAAAMYHAIGAPKPWRKDMIVSAIGGVPPTAADKAYVASTANPIRLYSPLGRARRRTECTLGAALGRFYRRR